MTLSRSTLVLIIYPLLMIILSLPIYYLTLPYADSLIIIENAQLFILAMGAVLSLVLAIKQPEKRLFWLWAMVWWILLIGRSINWGRLYYPDFPREYFRMIGVSIGLVIIIPLFFTKVRSQFLTILKAYHFPIIILITLIILFLAIDQIEQERILYTLLTRYISINDSELFEEIVETFFILCLFEFILYFAKPSRSLQSSKNYTYTALE